MNSDTPVDPTDEGFLSQVRNLEEAALSAVFSLYYPAIYRYIYHQIGHECAAEDLTGEVFQRLLEALERGAGPERNIQAWLYRVAYNLIVDDSRRQFYRQHETLDEQMPHDQPGIEDTAHQAIMARAAKSALDRLTQKQRSVIILRFLEGLSIAETAEVMKLPISAIKALQQRGLAGLRRHLKQAAAEEG